MGAHRGGGDIEEDADLGVAATLDHGQVEHRALAWGEQSQHPRRIDAVGAGGGRPRLGGRSERQPDQPTTAPTQGSAQQGAGHPGRERRGIAQLVEPLKKVQERVLHEILGPGLSRHRAGQAHPPLPVTLDQLTEGPAVPRAGSGHELDPIDAGLGGGGHDGESPARPRTVYAPPAGLSSRPARRRPAPPAHRSWRAKRKGPRPAPGARRLRAGPASRRGQRAGPRPGR